MFTATLIFQLIDEGRLNLSTTLDQYFPTVSNAGKITIGNMLSHRSGIHSFTNDSDYLVWMIEPKTRDEMVAIISSKKADFEPDARTEYSNSNFVLLGFILEEIYKKPYNAILQSRICLKAGLKDTYYGGKTDITKNESYSFRFMTSWEKQPETDMSIPHGAGAIVSTSSDLVKFIYALFAGQLVSDESLTKMKTITDGMGMGMQQFPYENKKIYGHGGAIDGFNSLLCYFPDEKIAIAYCSNGTVYSINDILLGALAIYFQKPFALPVFTSYDVTPEELQQYPGVYSSEQIPIKITITTDNGKLFGQGSGQPAFPMEASAKDIFKFEPAGIVIKFTPEKGEFVLEQGGGSFTFKK
jgi:CubicO group peptidase (beta-lactamase class C family)